MYNESMNYVPIATILGVLVILGLMLIGMTTDTSAQRLPLSWTASLGDGNRAHISNAACTSEKIRKLLPKPSDIKKLKHGRLEWVGRQLEACWFLVNDDALFLIDETGASGFLPTYTFALTTSIHWRDRDVIRD